MDSPSSQAMTRLVSLPGGRSFAWRREGKAPGNGITLPKPARKRGAGKVRIAPGPASLFRT